MNATRSPQPAAAENFIPAEWYVGDGVTRADNSRLWPRTWHCAGRIEELKETGDYFTFELLDDSLVIVRIGDNEFTALHNVCPHRGRRLKDAPRGNVRDGLYCGYHGWVMDLDGSVKSAPNAEDWCPGELGKLRMLKAQLDTWAGWIWVNLDPAAPPLSEYLGPAVDILAPLGLEKMRRAWHATLRAPVNWKVQYQAFNETYHAGATHDGFISYKNLSSQAVLHGDHAVFYSKRTGPCARRDTLGQWHEITDLREELAANFIHQYRNLHALTLEPTFRAVNRLLEEVPTGSPPEQVLAELWRLQREETEKTGAEWPEALTPENFARMGTDWQLFPSTLVLPSVDGALWYRILPSADGRSCLHDIWALGRFAPGEEPEIEDLYFDSFEDFKGVNPFLEEDFANLIAVDKGMRSRGWAGAVLNPRQEPQQLSMMQAIQRYISE
jgi:phenylpropionate dioxygenase-like ring-hydroxylating dioxygenase large terminal subunit